MGGVERSTYAVMLPCNWLQCHENSLDPVHFQWLHRYYGMWRASKVMQGETYDEFDRISAARGKAHVKIGFDRFEYGIIKRRMLEGEDEQSEWWRIGHPILFPYTLRVGQGTWFEFQHRVPVDDTHTLHFGYTIRTPEPGEAFEAQPMRHEERPAYFENGRIKDDWVVGQDQLAWIIQGPRMDRSAEALGVTDIGLIMFRNLLNEQIKVVEGRRRPGERAPHGERHHRAAHRVRMVPRLRPHRRPLRRPTARTRRVGAQPAVGRAQGHSSC